MITEKEFQSALEAEEAVLADPIKTMKIVTLVYLFIAEIKPLLKENGKFKFLALFRKSNRKRLWEILGKFVKDIIDISNAG